MRVGGKKSDFGSVSILWLSSIDVHIVFVLILYKNLAGRHLLSNLYLVRGSGMVPLHPNGGIYLVGVQLCNKRVVGDYLVAGYCTNLYLKMAYITSNFERLSATSACSNV